MHIPKTAGSSLNAYLEAQYPAAQSALHIENQVLGVPKEQLPTFEGKNFLSAHLKYDTLKDVLDVQQYFKMTMLRDRYNTRFVIFVDDAFSIDHKRVVELCQRMIDMELGISGL